MIELPSVEQLLDEIIDSNRTPEDVCHSCPERLLEVQERWRQMCMVRAELDVLFPPPLESHVDLSALPHEGMTFPEIPGYEVEAILGRGGMGIVFRARQLRLNRPVAIKMALAGAFSTPQERERFHREAEAVAGLKHPNVVQIYDFGETDGRPYFSMEFVEGGSLSQKLAAKSQPAREAAALLASLAEAVESAHQCGIVHRDLKPANILLTTAGTPKISDFGLARRTDGQTGLTRPGAMLGTPGYMPPEQAQGKPNALGPAIDLYSLGAILYEMLTGRPPFHAENAIDIVQQVIFDDPVPPSRLNAKVPRDLETICLKCLHKQPQSRYRSAAALAGDLHRFLSGDAIEARPESGFARFTRKVRQRPVLSTAVAVAMLSTVALIGGGFWAVSAQEAARRSAETKQAAADAELRAIEQAAETDLIEMETSLTKSAWPQANAALERARTRLGDRGSALLHQRIAQGRRNLKLVDKWDALRLNGFTRGELVGELDFLDLSRFDREYEMAFREAGFGSVGDDLEATSARIRTSHLRTFLVAELDYWAWIKTRVLSRRNWLLDVARLSDPDTTGWSGQAMNPENWKSEASIGKLLDSAPREYPPILILVRIDQAMTDLGRDPVPMMKRYQQAHSGDFWLNLRLADVLFKRRLPEESIRYYQAALAIRPGTSIVCNNLGFSLSALGRHEEAIEQYRRALEFDLSNGLVRANLAVLLSQLKRHDEAIETAQAALKLDERKDRVTALLHAVLGNSLKAKGQDAEALVEFQHAIALNARNLTAQSGLLDILSRQGKWEEVRAAWEKAIAAVPPQHDRWYGFAELCLFLGDEEAYRQARTKLLAKFGKSTDPYIAERTSRASLLLPIAGEELSQAVALAERAASVDRVKFGGVFRSFQFAQGFAEYRLGHFKRSIELISGEVSSLPGPSSRLVLAMSLYRNGQEAEARKTLAAAIAGHDWRTSNVRDQDGWIYHVLRREAERLMLPNLAAFLDGKYQPQDNSERLSLLGVCQFKNRTLAAARLYADAFEADPSLADDLGSGHRYNAARLAAQTGIGRGEDSASMTETDRKPWREQARTWLSADLVAWEKSLNGDPMANRERVRQKLTQWKSDANLACLRDPDELAKLSETERQVCLELWQQVGRLVQRTERAK